MHLTDCSFPHHQQPRLSSRHQAPIPAEGETFLRDNFRRTPSAERGFDLANLDHTGIPWSDPKNSRRSSGNQG